MEPKHLARDDISALAWDVEETSEEGRKTRLNDWTQAFLVVELRRARQSSGAASAVKMTRNRSALALARALLARSVRDVRSLSGEGPAGRVASAAIAKKTRIGGVRIDDDRPRVVVEGRRPALDAMNDKALGEKELGQVSRPDPSRR
jgi:hypothetical protein